MASTAATLSNVAEDIASTYAAQIPQKYVAVSLACWLLWDHVTTLDQEVKYIWCYPVNVTKLLFVLARYGLAIGYPLSLYQVFARADSPGICKFSLGFFVVFVFVSQVIQVALSLRVWALYARSWIIGLVLGLAYVVTLGICLHLYIMYYKGGPGQVPDVLSGTPQISGCIMEPVSGYYRGYIVTAAFDTIIVALTLWKVSTHMRNERSIPYLNYLLSSGVCYYLALLSVLLLSILSKPFPVLIIPIVSSGCVLVVQGVACSRIILGMMPIAEKANRGTPLAEAQTIETDGDHGFFTMPTGLFTTDMMTHWEYGLPPIDAEVGDEGVSVDIESVCMPSLDIQEVHLDA